MIYFAPSGLKIAIDGASGTGKSTLAKYLAKTLNYLYLDTGAMYRALAYYTKKLDLVSNDDKVYECCVSDLLNNNTIRISLSKVDGDNDAVYVHNETTNEYIEVSKFIRNEEISMLASRISKFECVRNFLVAQQKKAIDVAYHGVIAEGRDIATVVMPEADIKFFLTTDVEERAKRRYNDYDEAEQKQLKVEDIKNNLIKRDKQDSERENSPLIKVDDAILVNTTNMTIDAKNTIVLDIINQIRFGKNYEFREHGRTTKRQYEYDKVYMNMAFSMSTLSYAHRMKAGAIIVSKDDQIISQGYNGTPAGFANCCEELDENGNLRTKDIVLHAEANAITKCAKSNMSSVDGTIYITASPCINCAKMIIQAGIRRVVYCDDYRSDEGIKLLHKSGITVEKIKMNPTEDDVLHDRYYTNPFGNCYYE